MKIRLLFFLVSVNTLLFSQNEIRKWNFNLVNSLGFAYTRSDDPNPGLPYDISETSFGFQSNHLGEIIYYTRPRLGIGLGGGINLRSGEYIHEKKNYSDKYYFALQMRNEKRSILFQLQVGTMRGVITNSYLAHLGIGFAWCLLNQRKINIQLRPFIDFNFSEKVTKYGHHPHDYSAPYYPKYYYTLTYKTMSVNFALILGFSK